MKKLFLLFSLFLLVGCTSMDIPKGFEEETLTSHSTTIIEQVNASTFEKVYDQFRDDLKPLITLEELSLNLETKLQSVGVYQSMKSPIFSETKDPNTDELYAVVIVVCQHKQGTATYTLSYNSDYELVGFYIK